MMSRDFSQTVVVFDLDDTLYKEADYSKSGLEAISKFIKNFYDVDIMSGLFRKRDEGEKDLLAAACVLASLPLAVKESLLWIHRLHVPTIELDKDTSDFLNLLESQSKKIVILTDGRSVTQRLKLEALGLMRFPVYISEEYLSEKPNLFRFEKIMSDYSAEHYIYIADNPAKDFIAPKMLGWETCGLLDDGRNIHSQN